MSHTFDRNLIKYALYGVSAIVLSEIGYRYFNRWANRCSQLRAVEADNEIADVIWINELTQECSFKSPNKSEKFKHDDENCRNKFCLTRNIGKLITLIDNAKYSIDLSMYIFTSFELYHALVRAYKRGLEIRIISDQEMVYSSGSQITSLTKFDIPVRYPRAVNMLMHHKFCILDGPTRSRAVSEARKKSSYKQLQGILFTGSLNWTHQGFNSNFENLIITSNVKLVAKFEEEFRRMWVSLNDFDHSTQNAQEK